MQNAGRKWTVKNEIHIYKIFFVGNSKLKDEKFTIWLLSRSICKNDKKKPTDFVVTITSISSQSAVQFTSILQYFSIEILYYQNFAKLSWKLNYFISRCTNQEAYLKYIYAS